MQAVDRIRALSKTAESVPTVFGVELHAASAAQARTRIGAAGGDRVIVEGDFFLVEPSGEYSVVIGNPPFIRYQAFAGLARSRSREAALKAGVSLSALASSWAAFTVRNRERTLYNTFSTRISHIVM